MRTLTTTSFGESILCLDNENIKLKFLIKKYLLFARDLARESI